MQDKVKKYQIIYADPPWDYKGQLQHTGQGGKDSGGATKHYGCMKLADLKKLDVPSLCDEDCLMFMWATSPHLDQAIELLKAWGFSWATVGFVWDKQKVNPGFYTMSQVELCLIGKRGKIPKPRGARNIRQMVSVMRGNTVPNHRGSKKRIEEMFPEQNKIELFARDEVQKAGTCHGNEVEAY
jgi:N6-adenosine-specific RNA methylase IME4